MRFAIFALLLACSSPGTNPAPASPATPATPATPADPSAPATPAAADAGPKLGEKCGANDACGTGKCMTYSGIAGPNGPQFKSCEIACKDDSGCPSGTKCGLIADGPGHVCR
jgi:hypothetical protein